MAYQLTERPHKFSFTTNNPVRYVFQITNPEATGCALDVELYTLPINEGLPASGFGELITAQTLYPNPDGKVFFYCEDFLNSYLEWELPSLTTNDVLAVTKQIRKFFVRYRQVTKANPSPAWSSDSAALRIALKGGIAKEKYDGNNFFVNYLPSKKPFLTWQPADHFIGTEERRYLTYFHYADSTPELFLKARVVYTDGAQDTATVPLPPLSDSLLFHLPAGLQQLGLYGLQPDKKVWYYDVSVEDDSGNVYAAPYRLTADYRMFYNVFSFIYSNSLGGIDTLRIRGEYDIEINREYTEIQQATGGDFGTILPTENAVVNISKYEVYKGDAGMLNTRRQQDALQDLLLSDTVYRVVNGRWLRVINLQKAQALAGTDDTKYNFQLQWRYTFNNTQYTPGDLDFGAGTPEVVGGPLYGVCTAPDELNVIHLDDPGGRLYRFFWGPVIGAEGYELAYQLPGATDWTTVEVTDGEADHIDISFPGDGEHNWKLRTKCSESDFSGYTSGVGFYIGGAGGCTPPGGATVILLNLSDNIATIKLGWQTAAGVGYVVEWREIGAATWNSAQVAGSGTLSYTLNVNRDTQYQWRVRTKCDASNTSFSNYLWGNNFIPSSLIGSCSAPVDISVEVDPRPQNGKGIIVKWTNPGGSDSFYFQTREKGIGTWMGVDNITGVYYFFFLSDQWEGKTMECRMRSNCTGGGFSNFIYGPDYIG